MRSLFAATRSARGASHSLGRSLRWLPHVLGLGLVLLGGNAGAEDTLPDPPLVPLESDQTLSAQPAQPPAIVEAPPAAPQPPPQATTTTTTVTTTTSGPPAPALAPPAPALAPPAPTGPRAPIYVPGPAWLVPVQPGLQSLPPPPVHTQPVAPPYRIKTATCCTGQLQQRRYARPPIFSVGARFTTMGTGQEVFGQNLTLMGGGLQLRFRNRGHFGFETAFDVLRANIGDGLFVRTAYPWSSAVMIYIFRNRPETHFNIFGLAGLGLQASDVVLYQRSRQERQQQFLELLGQVGGGVELRFRYIALSADLRMLGLMLDETSPGGSYYTGIEGGPIPSSSLAWKANIGALVWF